MLGEKRQPIRKNEPRIRLRLRVHPRRVTHLQRRDGIGCRESVSIGSNVVVGRGQDRRNQLNKEKDKK